MRYRSLAAAALVLGFGLACAGGETEDQFLNEDGEGEGDAAEVEPGAIHLDFPAVSLEAEPGQYALVPSRSFLDRALGGESSSFIYYMAELVEVGDVESKVESLAGSEETMPNSLIVPIEKGYQAKKGDVLLGHWESGSGLQRAIVVGGTETEPVVRYLDMSWDNPSGWGQKEDTWEKDRFHPLTEAGQIGTTVACEDGDDHAHGILVAEADDQVLVSGFASALSVHAVDDCVSLNPRPSFAEGDEVWVPAVGKYVQGEVKKIDDEVGRIWVAYTWGGSEKEEAFALVDVTKSFDPDDQVGGEEDEGAEENDRPRRRPRARRPGSNDRASRR